MKRFAIGLLAGIVLTGLSLVIIVFAAFRMGDRRPTVPDDATLILSLSGEIPEKAPVENPLPFIGSPTPNTVYELWSALKKAGTDPRIKAVVLQANNVGAGWAKLHELRESLLAYKKSGKPLIAFLRSPGTREYYLASAADKIYFAPEDLLQLKGLRAEMSYYKGTLDKLGVQVEVEAVGRYKDGGDMFTETGMSPETRDVMNSVLDRVYGDLVAKLASGRKKTPEQIRQIIDEGPYTAKQAAKAGLVDGLLFEDQVFGELKKQLGQKELKKLSHSEYVRAVVGTDTDARKKIAWVVGEGTIMRGSGEDQMGSDEGFTSGAFIQMLRKVANDGSIAGVILRVDSPGGDAFASDDILREIQLLRQKKPMVISMSDMAASGGYYVSMTGDPILAYPNTLTGSIGVFWGKLNLRGFYDKVGIRKEMLTRGKNAAIDTTYSEMTPEARTKLREGLEEFYASFVSKAATSRKKSYQELDALAQGRVWLGSQAKEQGLIDELGGIDRAVELIKQKSKIAAADKVELVPYPPKRSIWEQYLKTRSEPSVEEQLQALATDVDFKLWKKGGTMRMMPFKLTIQ